MRRQSPAAALQMSAPARSKARRPPQLKDSVLCLSRPHFPQALPGTWQQLHLPHHPHTPPSLPPNPTQPNPKSETTKRGRRQSRSRASPCGQDRDVICVLCNPPLSCKALVP
ncbi:uncharacterized protein LOC123621894 isoform X6 [Lemur catta]|uniref:uncharacterized protein LOC123621894 isoform X6 n=1 Tax=Lemur catta TaxID=9447 RepID=UPI001E26D5B9|nr:uncharacterized protein LOC123621894 isoform X6 [Lemur catta]